MNSLFSKLILLHTLALSLLCITGCSSHRTTDVSLVDDLLSEMTLEEKIGQMNMYSGFFDPTGPQPEDDRNKIKYDHIRKGYVGAMLNVKGAKETRELQRLAVENSRLGIPMLFGFDVIHGHKTVMPVPLAEAASWDLELIEESARIAAVEASAQGIHWTFAPMVDISRDPRWGRVMEGAGEDVHLGSEIARARIRGFQGSSLADTNTIAACAKHFAGYGFVSAGREYNSVDIGGTTLWNIVFPPFIASVEEGVATVMNSFNEINGQPSTSDKWLHQSILKGKWGFDGFIVSDWGTVKELITHGVASDQSMATQLAVEAGCDMDMESYFYVNYLADLVREKHIDISRIDEAVRRILQLKKDLGLFDDPYKYCSEVREKRWLNHPDHHAFALEMAKESMVLLKNDSMLPLNQEGLKIGVIGPLAASKNSPLGSWRLGSDDNSAISVLEGLKQYRGNEVRYEKGVDLWSGQEKFHLELEINQTDKGNWDRAIQLAKNSDVVLMVLGEHGFQSGEARSRTDLGLPGFQQQLMQALYEVNPNMVLVLMNGRPLAIPWAAEHIPAILEAWQPGSQGGHAIAQVLYGEHNPSGKLPMTFPRSVGQIPIYYYQKHTGRPESGRDVFWSHYIDESNQPLWPFGYGLSYTNFEYTHLEATVSEDRVLVEVDLKNVGEVNGTEIVQLYVRDPVASLTRPIKELKGFQKIELDAGEEVKVRFDLSRKDLGFYDAQGNWKFEPGMFHIVVDQLNTEVHFE